MLSHQQQPADRQRLSDIQMAHEPEFTASPGVKKLTAHRDNNLHGIGNSLHVLCSSGFQSCDSIQLRTLVCLLHDTS